MKVFVKTKEVKDYLSKSNLPSSDYVINPYVGCPHDCQYCYARYMKKFTGHTEDWGEFLDVKICDKPLDYKKLYGKTVFMSSVTDCYNPFEKKYGVTRKILEGLLKTNCKLVITTKSDLILRDLDLLKQFKSLKVAISVNTLDEEFKNDMDKASSIEKRIKTLKTLNENGIYTMLFLAPIFPKITDCKEIIKKTHPFINEFWLENLKLRYDYKPKILNYIKLQYPKLYPLYVDIYINNKMDFWNNLSDNLDVFCDENNISNVNNFFHYKKIKKPKNIETSSDFEGSQISLFNN